MANFPEIMIYRYYEDWTIEVTYSDDGSEKNKDTIYRRLEKQQEEDKHLETSEIFLKWENLQSEEDREKWEIEWKKKNKI